MSAAIPKSNYARAQTFTRALPDDETLPFEIVTDYEINKASGSWIAQIRLHPDRLELANKPCSKELFAVKCSSLQVGGREHDILQLAAGNQRLHIVQMLDSFLWRDRVYLIFPSATMDARMLLQTKTNRLSRPPSALALVSQLAGLSEALHFLHSRGITHNDIRPSNVLVFDDPVEFGKLSLADMGSAFLPDRDSVDTAPAQLIGTYQAPETMIETKCSQPADMWSFGCFMLDLLVWIRHGPRAVSVFADNRVQTDWRQGFALRNDWFFECEGSRKLTPEVPQRMKELNKGVVNVISSLGAEVRVRTRTDRTAIREVLHLIEDTLLRIDPSERCTASTLASELAFISETLDMQGETGVRSCVNRLRVLPRMLRGVRAQRKKKV